ncbi:MAG: VOC family protein [Gemmatimonadaceae bacterium]|nr:VOC family protein [Gemmatimonadaceae bacterium]
MSWTASKVTAVLAVPAVEPSLAFWEHRLGFTRVVEVPHGDALGFVILVKGATEVMLQSVASIREDLAGGGDVPGTSTVLFLELDDLDAAVRQLGDYPIAMARRTTFYGMDEIGVRDPGGHLIVLAQKVATAGG